MKQSIISDANEELVLTYRVVKDDVEALISRLQQYQNAYDILDDSGRDAMYFKIRSDLNAERKGFDFTTYGPAWVNRAATLLFLNKTCFNGLFRVNSKGEFNVPFGKYTNPSVVNALNLRKASAVLARTTILHGDFSQCMEHVSDRSFVYLDPPYRPLNATSKFTSYSQDGFGDADQVRLRDFFAEADLRGAKVMLSNSDPKNENPDDHFFDDLYQAFIIDRVKAKRAINRDADKRGSINEIIVRNYEPENIAQ
jgi:DNA adenine methylase